MGKPYHEGDWFAVPLKAGKYAVGIVARANDAHGVVLGYFFGPVRSAIPALSEVESARPPEAILVAHFGDLGLQNGSWPILGQRKPWRRELWPMPAFRRIEELTDRTFSMHYADNDPNELLYQEEVPPGAADDLPADGMYGAGAMQLVLSHRLGI